MKKEQKNAALLDDSPDCEGVQPPKQGGVREGEIERGLPKEPEMDDGGRRSAVFEGVVF